MRGIAIKYGLLGGAILIVTFGIAWAITGGIDFETGMITGYASMILALSTIYFAIKQYRDERLGGVISFGRALMMGLYVSVVTSIIYVAGWLVYSSIAMPDFMEKYTAHVIGKMKESGASQAEIEATQKEFAGHIEDYKNPLVKISYTFIEIFPVGFLVSLVSAALLRRKVVRPAG